VSPNGRRRGSWSVQELERLRKLFPRRGVLDTAILLRRSPECVRRKALELLRVPPRRGPWDPQDDLVLRQAWGVLEPRLLGLLVGRPQSEVLRRAEALRRSRCGAWTHAEEAALREFYGSRTDRDLEVCMAREVGDIAAAAARLCLAKDKRFVARLAQKAVRRRMPRWSSAEIRQLRALYADRDNLEVARLLGRSVISVANKANQLGLRKAPALLARIGRANVAGRRDRVRTAQRGDTAGDTAVRTPAGRPAGEAAAAAPAR
jgi:hypothetical protein